MKTNTKTKLILLFAVIAIGGVKGAPVKANQLAIDEMEAELVRVQEKKDQSDISLAKEKDANKKLKKTIKLAKKTIKLAKKTNEAKQAAQAASMESVAYDQTKNPYLADTNHAHGEASLIIDNDSRLINNMKSEYIVD